MKHTKSTSKIFLAGVFLVFVVILLASKSRFSYQQTGYIGTPVPVATPEILQIDNEWQQYVSTRLGFSMNFPVKAAPDNVVYGTDETDTINFVEIRTENCSTTRCIKVSVSVTSAPIEDMSVEEKYKSRSFSQNITIGNVAGKRTASTFNENGEEFFVARVEGNNRKYYFEVGSDKGSKTAVSKMIASFESLAQ